MNKITKNNYIIDFDNEISVLSAKYIEAAAEQKQVEDKNKKQLKMKKKITKNHARYAIKSKDNEYIYNFRYETEYLGCSLTIIPEVSLDIDDALLFSERYIAEDYVRKLAHSYKKYKVVKAN